MQTLFNESVSNSQWFPAMVAPRQTSLKLCSDEYKKGCYETHYKKLAVFHWNRVK